MLIHDLKDCPNCESVYEVICRIDHEIYNLSKKRWDNIRLDLDECSNDETLEKLIAYKRILLKKLFNSNYICCVSLSDILSGVKRLTGGYYRSKFISHAKLGL